LDVSIFIPVYKQSSQISGMLAGLASQKVSKEIFVTVDEPTEEFKEEIGRLEQTNVTFIQNRRTAYNESTDITIDVSAQDNFVLPCKSYLLIEGVLKTGTDAVYDAKANVSLVNNAVAFLFSKVAYLLNGSEVESISDPGQATTMRGILMYDENYNSSTGMSLGWVRDMGDGTAKRRKYGPCFKKQFDNYQSPWTLLVCDAVSTPVRFLYRL